MLDTFEQIKNIDFENDESLDEEVRQILIKYLKDDT